MIARDCPDPGVTRDGDGYLLTCTSSAEDGPAFPLFRSTDLLTWDEIGSVFPDRPSWAIGDFWAPELHRIDGNLIAYYTARAADDRLVLGAAARAGDGFRDLGEPLLDGGPLGLIDPNAFVDSDGTPYLLWKDDGNAVGEPTPLHLQTLTADGLSLTDDEPVDLLDNDRAWEGDVTEAPFLFAHDGRYYLFYSGGSYADETYGVGVARADSITGPYEKAPAPILFSGGPWVGPGHCSVVDAPDGGTAIVYHAWRSDCVGDDGCERQVLVDRIAWIDGWPTVP